MDLDLVDRIWRQEGRQKAKDSYLCWHNSVNLKFALSYLTLVEHFCEEKNVLLGIFGHLT